MIDISTLKNKVEDRGATPAGRLQASEWNTLVGAVEELQDESYVKPDTGIPTTDIIDANLSMTQAEINQETNVALAGKQAALVSGTNIKTVNGESILGSGNISAGDPDAIKYSAQTLTDAQKTQARVNIGAQDALVSGTNLKTINQNSLLGSGDITIENGEDGVGFDSISTPATADGTVVITLSSGDTMTLDLNHNHPNYFDKLVGATIPSGGLVPDVAYKLGTLTGEATITLASAVSGCLNHYYFTFSAPSTAPTITWPVSVTKWSGNCVTSNAPVISASKNYEVSILDGVGFIYES